MMDQRATTQEVRAMAFDSKEPANIREQASFFGVIANPQSYRNLLYLLLGLPLGTLYFTALVTGFSVGLSMLVLALVGIPLLIGLWYLIRGFMALEHGLASGLLHVDIAPLAPVPPRTKGWWARFKALWTDKPSWKGTTYLLGRFPAGIATFTLAVTLVSTSLGMAFAPTYMWTSDDITWGSQTFDPFPWSFALVPLGVLMTFVSLHLMNALADGCARWARASLGGTPPRQPPTIERVDLTTPQPADAEHKAFEQLAV
jgi:hypothetical protein